MDPIKSLPALFPRPKPPSPWQGPSPRQIPAEILAWTCSPAPHGEASLNHFSVPVSGPGMGSSCPVHRGSPELRQLCYKQVHGDSLAGSALNPQGAPLRGARPEPHKLGTPSCQGELCGPHTKLGGPPGASS